MISDPSGRFEREASVNAVQTVSAPVPATAIAAPAVSTVVVQPESEEPAVQRAEKHVSLLGKVGAKSSGPAKPRGGAGG